MRDLRRFFMWCIWLVLLLFYPFTLQAQAPEREYVIATGDQLNIQVWNQVQPLPNFSGQVEVRSDRMITMPWLGDIQAAGLKKSTLTTNLESKDLLGKYLNEPHVTITPVRMAENIRVFFSGVFPMEQQVPREVRLGTILQELLPQLQQYNPNPDAILVRSAEGEEFPADPNLRLQWGDEVVIPSQTILPTPSETSVQPVPSSRVQFTPEEYQEFQQLLQDYPETQQLLQQFVTIEDDNSVTLDLEMLPESLRQELPEEVMTVLAQHAVPVQEAPPPLINAQLLGIRVNLLGGDGLHEAFLALPDPDSDQGTVIRVFQEKDVVQQGDTDAETIVLAEIHEEAKQVVLRKGEETQVLSLASQFSSVALSGILTLEGEPQAVLSGLMSSTPTHPIQRKRYKEGDFIGTDVRLVKILESQQMVVLQKGQELQLVFLHDPSKRIVPAPSPASPPVGPEESLPEAIPLPGEQLPLSMPAPLQQSLMAPLDAMNTFSELFFATPILE